LLVDVPVSIGRTQARQVAHTVEPAKAGQGDPRRVTHIMKHGSGHEQLGILIHDASNPLRFRE